MKKKDISFHQSFNVRLNLGFVIRVNPEELGKIKNFIESLEKVVVVHSQVSGNRLYIVEEGSDKKQEHTRGSNSDF